MKLKLQIIGDGEVLFEMPLYLMEWPREQLENELDSFEAEFKKLSRIFTALSNETRIMMMRQLIQNKDHTVKFTDFMRDLDLNPKLVRDNTRKLSESGLIEKVGRGTYRCSQLGEPGFIMISLALRKLIETLD